MVRLRSGSLLSVARYPPLTGSKLASEELHQEGNDEEHQAGVDTFPHSTLDRVHRSTERYDVVGGFVHVMTWSGGSSVAPLVVVVPSAFLMSSVMRMTRPG